MTYDIPETVATLTGFRALDEAGLEKMVADYGLAMDVDDLRFCRDYFQSEDRDPTITELRVIDTYWSDHCRHTTFHTTIDGVEFASRASSSRPMRTIWPRARSSDRTKPINLMDIGHHWRQAPEKAGQAGQTGRVRRDQRLHREDQGRYGQR